MEYLDLPDLSRARIVRATARGIAIRDGERAVAVAFLSDGSLVPGDLLVRFDVAHGEEPARRLSDALAATGARGVWFFGGDDVLRRAALELDLLVRPSGAAFARRARVAPAGGVAFRLPSQRDRLTLPELLREHAPAFRTAVVEFAQVGGDEAGFVAAEALDAVWTELRAFVHPARRGRGYGAAMLAASAERFEAGGRHVCAATESAGGRERTALETAGFRLVDYYFTAVKR